MPVQNAEIADAFDEIGDLLEIEGANPFRIRAYRNAARVVRGLPRALYEMVGGGENLTEIEGIGRDLAGKIVEIVTTGQLSFLDKIRRATPRGVRELMNIPGLGAKRARKLHDELGIENLEQLAAAARDGRVRDVPGFGAKTEALILAAARQRVHRDKRFLWIEAEPVAMALIAYLRGLDGVRQVEVAGSFRRRCETVGDLDILATCKRGTAVMEHFVAFEDVQRVVSQGTTRATVVLRSGLQVDLRVVADVSFGAALHYFTGSKAHNIAVRQMAVRKKLKVNEYGVFRGDERIAGRSEKEIYALFGMTYIEPELREQRGEIEAARKGKLPRLVELGDLRGDLHTHTVATDGRSTIEEMACEAQRRGYEYLAISDHTAAARVAKGLDAKKMRRHLAAIEKANAKLRGLRLLKAAEVDILADGSLDLPDDLLAELDVVIGAVHSHFDLPRDKQMTRLLRAMDHPRFHILAHPTGRLIGRRDPCDIDIDGLVAAAAERGCFLELNAQPERLDLSDVHARVAAEGGVKLAISTDAHSAAQLDYLRLGVGIARRAWLEKSDVLNALPWTKLEKLLLRR
jgi:DNA polymerase (family 10)